MARKLRIAVSLSCAAVIALLIGLWVRSYRTCDVYGRWPMYVRNVGAISFEGQLHLIGPYQHTGGKRKLKSFPASQCAVADNVLIIGEWAGVRVVPPYSHFVASYLLLISLVVPPAILAWVPWAFGFNLRSLIIGVTLFAVELGAIAESFI